MNATKTPAAIGLTADLTVLIAAMNDAEEREDYDTLEDLGNEMTLILGRSDWEPIYDGRNARIIAIR